MTPKPHWTVYTDGGSRDGLGAYGIVLYNERGAEVHRESGAIGEATNNDAEFVALKQGISAAVERGAGRLVCYVDSKLVQEMSSGSWRGRNLRLRELRDHVLAVATLIPHGVEYRWIPRAENRVADALATSVHGRGGSRGIGRGDALANAVDAFLKHLDGRLPVTEAEHRLFFVARQDLREALRTYRSR